MSGQDIQTRRIVSKELVGIKKYLRDNFYEPCKKSLSKDKELNIDKFPLTDDLQTPTESNIVLIGVSITSKEVILYTVKYRNQ